MNGYKTFILELTTLEPLAASSGEGRSLIDNDILYDKSGLPYIPAKRVRGALKESAQELLEMGYQSSIKLEEVFGKDGSQWSETEGVLLDNFRLKGYEDYLSDIIREKVKPSSVINYFTNTNSQTAINHKTGSALKFSLRTFRVLKTGLVFTSSISCPQGIEDFIRKALLNLNRLGTRRNRGWGKVKFTLADAAENNHLAGGERQLSVDFNAIKITIKTNAPVVLGGIQSDESTVNSDTYFRGNILRGIVASHFLGDTDFELMFNQGKLLFTPAFADGSVPIPLCLHEEKGEEVKAKIFNVFSRKTITPTRSLKGTAIITGKELQTTETETFSNFHHNRHNNRTAARSTDGKIFYYEAISEQQQFTGYIHGDQTLLRKILEKNITEARVGRSQRTQYGKIEINLEPVKLSQTELVPGEEVYISFDLRFIAFMALAFL